jgi:hypothetical protein
MEMACHPSYPLNSENASPPGTFTVYLSCAEMALPTKMASTNAIMTITQERVTKFLYGQIENLKY